MSSILIWKYFFVVNILFLFYHCLPSLNFIFFLCKLVCLFLVLIIIKCIVFNLQSPNLLCYICYTTCYKFLTSRLLRAQATLVELFSKLTVRPIWETNKHSSLYPIYTNYIKRQQYSVQLYVCKSILNFIYKLIVQDENSCQFFFKPY